ncbi:TPA: hypothetical protein L7M60_004905, partial [Klebsiella pneumoniae]|nr:hypothetical protein [Klebsiella pneumoniae]HBU7319462.1 hypothetical protein [Klebsiella pneumoniae]
MSENNYGALMMKSPLSANVDIDGILRPGIYPVPSGNLSSPDPEGGVLTVYTGKDLWRSFHSYSMICSVSQFDFNNSKWSEWNIPVSSNSLISHDGYRLIGKCPSISVLRVTEPTEEWQSIILHRSIPEGHEINTVLWYDAEDTKTPDDGYSVFVTGKGARWKADVSRGIDVRLAGLLADNSNLGTVLNAVINGEVNKIKAAGTIKGAITNIFIPASRKTYTVDTSVFIPSFMCLNTDGYVYMNYPSTTGSAFSINNASLAISSGGMPSNPADVQGCKIF